MKRPRTVEELGDRIEAAFRSEDGQSRDTSDLATMAARVAWDALHGELDVEAARMKAISLWGCGWDDVTDDDARAILDAAKGTR
jgi:hypothetical protein